MGASRPIMDERPVVGPEPRLAKICCNGCAVVQLTVATVVEVEKHRPCIRGFDRAPQCANDGKEAYDMKDQQSYFNPGEFAGEECHLRRVSLAGSEGDLIELQLTNGMQKKVIAMLSIVPCHLS
jgi:hypothetical protein